MPEPSIKSRPVYGVLAPQPGAMHVMVADAKGGAALLDLARAAPPGFWAASHVIYVAARPDPAGHGAALRALSPRLLEEVDGVAAAMARLGAALGGARMGTRLYLAGTEGLIGLAMGQALAAGVELGAIATEHRGSLARRVQCVHCKGFTENVTTQPVACAGCGLNLFVRDHYSRRLAAFQGVCIEAEEPGTAPAPEEVFA